MTAGYAILTIGAIAIFTGLKNMTVADILRGGKAGDSSNLLGSDVTDAGFVHDTSNAVKDVGAVTSAVAGGGKHAKGVATYNGKQVAAWMVPWLKKAEQAGWDGCLSSGYRTPEYSESLCQDMCGAPSCPGTCAGRSSNHSGKVYPAGAIDVCNPESFQAAANKVKGFPLKNDLPADRVHFSFTGH